jgi:hypothetical protein
LSAGGGSGGERVNGRGEERMPIGQRGAIGCAIIWMRDYMNVGRTSE